MFQFTISRLICLDKRVAGIYSVPTKAGQRGGLKCIRAVIALSSGITVKIYCNNLQQEVRLERDIVTARRVLLD